MNKKTVSVPFSLLSFHRSSGGLHRKFIAEPSSVADLVKLEFTTDILRSNSLHIEAGFEISTFSLLLPKFELPHFSPTESIQSIERSALDAAQSAGIYPNDKFAGLSATQVSGLAAIAYGRAQNYLEANPINQREESPQEYKELLGNVTKKLIEWIAQLFAVDDWVDYNTQQVDPIRIREARERLLEVFQRILNGDSLYDKQSTKKSILRSDDTNLTKAMARTFVELSRSARALGVDNAVFLKCFIDSFDNYLQSVELERRMELGNRRSGSLDSSLLIRDDCSGARHAIQGAAACYGINSVRLESKFYPLKIMLQETARCVEYSNDILSWIKEASAFIKSSRKKMGVDPKLPWTNQEIMELHANPALNIVQVMWNKKTVTNPVDAVVKLKEAFKEVVDKHNEAMCSFYQYFNDELKTDFRLSRESSLSKEVMAYAHIMEGWLGQTWWELLVPRYSVGAKLPTDYEYQTLQRELRQMKPLDGALIISQISSNVSSLDPYQRML